MIESELPDMLDDIGKQFVSMGEELRDTSIKIKGLEISLDDRLSLLAVLRPMADNMIQLTGQLRTYINNRDLR